MKRKQIITQINMKINSIDFCCCFLLFVCLYLFMIEFIHSSIIIICGGFATLVTAALMGADGITVDAANVVVADAPEPTIEAVVSVVFSSFSSFLSLVVVVDGNVCAANCHFDAAVGSGTR